MGINGTPIILTYFGPSGPSWWNLHLHKFSMWNY